MAVTQSDQPAPTPEAVPLNPPDQQLTYCTITTPGGDFNPLLKMGPAGLETIQALKPGDNKPLPPKVLPPNQPIVEMLPTGYIVELKARGGT